MPRWDELKRRKIVQWALAYLAGAWLVVEALDLFGEAWGVPPTLVRIAHVALAFGFFVVLVFAWYHGEQGRQQVSGPELLMVAALLLLAGAAISIVGSDGSAGAGDAATGGMVSLPPFSGDSIPTRSIAVLPLDDHSRDAGDAYFADAMTEEITSALVKNRSLRVSARNSAAKFHESGLTVGEFARGRLGVAYALEGSVQLHDDRGRITVQLIDAATEEHVWSHSYEADLIDLLDVQVEIARQVADRLATTFTEQDRERTLAGATADPVAYELYLRATQLGVSEEEFEQSFVLLREALERDPSFSLAWAELGTAYFWRRIFGSREDRWADSIRASFDRALATAGHPALETRFEATKAFMLGEDRQRAVSLLTEAVQSYPSDRDLVMSLATGHWYLGDRAAAAVWTRRAVDLDPLDAALRSRLAEHYTWLGLDDLAEEALMRAVAIDPASPVPWSTLVGFHLLGGRLDAASAAVDSVYMRDGPEARLDDGLVHFVAGDFQAAYEIFRSVPEEQLEDAFWIMPTIAHVALAVGDSARATRLTEAVRDVFENLPEDPVVAERRLETAAAWGDVEASVLALERYIAAGGRHARLIRMSPLYGRARADAEFEARLRDLESIVEQQRRRLQRTLDSPGG